MWMPSVRSVPNCGSTTFTTGNISPSQRLLPAPLSAFLGVCYVHLEQLHKRPRKGDSLSDKFCTVRNFLLPLVLRGRWLWPYLNPKLPNQVGWNYFSPNLRQVAIFQGVKLNFIWETAFRYPRRQVTQVLKPEHQLKTKTQNGLST